jgi:hypothetical protein
MAISFTCTACDSDLKVKDELAGRKIKCPKCGDPTRVPPAEEEEDVEEEEEEEVKPKKSKKGKKKQTKSNTGLILALCGGGVLLLGGIILAAVFLFPGKGNDTQAKKAPPPEEKKQPSPEEKKEPKKEDNKFPPKENISAVARQRDLIEYRNYFRQIGTAYAGILSETGKPPKNKEDIKRYLGGGGALMDRLEKGYIQFVYNVGPKMMPEGPSNTIVAFEPYFDNNGFRLVIMGDGSVREMNLDEWARAPKAQSP